MSTAVWWISAVLLCGMAVPLQAQTASQPLNVRRVSPRDVALVMDLMAELTRAANYVCDRCEHLPGPPPAAQECALLCLAG
jgi:hypothetical protein